MLRAVSVADPGGGGEGAMAPPPGPVKISHKKDGCRIRPHKFHVSRPPSTRLLDPLLGFRFGILFGLAMCTSIERILWLMYTH